MASIPPGGSLPPAAERPPRILLLDAAERLYARVGPSLEQCGYAVVARSPEVNLTELLEEIVPDLVLVAINLPDTSGFELCGEIRATELGRQATILVLSDTRADEETTTRGLLCGADDFLAGPVGILELQARVRVQLRNRRERDRLSRVRRERDSFRREAVQDQLTGLANRRALDLKLEAAFNGSVAFALLFADVDHFKSVNDTFGHAVGDQVLKAVAGALRGALRPEEFCGRYGGEEFAILVPERSEELALAAAERLRRAVETIHVARLDRKLTVSLGVALFKPERPDGSIEELSKRADAALYEAKMLGRNRVQLSERDQGATVIVLPAPPRSGVAPRHDGSAVEAYLLKELATGRAGLPMLPKSAAEALRLAEDPRSDMVNIAKLVERDPPLAARFIAIASSVVYSRGVQVTSMQAALVRIGLAAARDLLLQVVYERSNGELSRYQAEVGRSFEHSVKTALASRIVARELHVGYEHAYLCGLLHDIGESRIYRILARMPGAPITGPVVEDLVARHHTRAGADVAKAWKLPAGIAEACMTHHDDVTRVAPPVKVIMAAEALIRTLDTARERDPDGVFAPEVGEADAHVLASVGIGEDRITALLGQIANQIVDSRRTETNDD